MNTDQITSIFRGLLKAGGGALVAHGVTQASATSELTQLAAGVIAFLVGQIWSHFTHADNTASPQAPGPTTAKTGAATFNLMLGLALMSCLVFPAIMVGCASLQKGADPIVVRTEQAEKGAKAGFDLFLDVEGGTPQARIYWMSNAPAMHSFAESLREPVFVGTNFYPKCVAMVISLDMVKQDYKFGRATSNDLFTALTTTEGLLSQASAWLTILTNNPTK